MMHYTEAVSSLKPAKGDRRPGKSTLLAGASGLVGSHCLTRLLDHPRYDRVTVWVRKPLPITHPKLIQQVVDFDRLHQFADQFEADDVFCCLGTTIKQAGTQAAFEQVDLVYPRELARLAAQRGAKRFLLISALGADPSSRFFYNRVKGEVEQAVRAAGVERTYIFRPSLLTGERREFRLFERLAPRIDRVIAPLLIRPLARYRPIHADVVAAAMVYTANSDLPSGVFESDQIRQLAAAS
jgi:uncharacterized protein YbjT (DUF2867 family)